MQLHYIIHALSSVMSLDLVARSYQQKHTASHPHHSHLYRIRQFLNQRQFATLQFDEVTITMKIYVVALKSSWSSYFAGNWTKHWLAWCIIRSTSAGLPSTESWSSSAQSVLAKMKKKTFEIFQPLTPAARMEFNNLCWIKRGESLMKKKSWQDFAKLFWRKLTNSFWKN